MREVARLVPVVAVLAPAAQVGVDENPTGIDPDAARGGEAGRLAQAVPAVAVEERGVPAVQLRAFAPDDVEGNPGAVLGSGEVADHLAVGVIGDGGDLKLRLAQLAVRRQPEEGGRRKVGADVEEHVAVLEPSHLVDR